MGPVVLTVTISTGAISDNAAESSIVSSGYVSRLKDGKAADAAEVRGQRVRIAEIAL